MKSELSIDIDRPREAVFDVVLKDVAAWSITCVEDERLEDVDDGGVGTRFRTVTEERGRRTEMTGEVTAHDPPRSSRCYLVSDAFEIDVHYDFEELPTGTRVTQRSEVTFKGFMKVLMALLGWAFKKSACDAQLQELQAMKAYAEEQLPA